MTTITAVVEKEPHGRRWWLITTADGVKYSTKNQFLAALAERCRAQETPVTITAGNGWWYRELWTLEPVGKDAVA